MESVSRRISGISGHLVVEPTNSSSKCPALRENCCANSGTSKCSCKSGVCPITGKSLNKYTDSTPLRVVITGAAGNIAYSLIFMIANGNVFGPRKPVILHLLDIPPMAQALKGIEMELIDCAFPLVKDIVSTTDLKTAFMHVDVAILVGAFPRQKGMERKDLLKKNASIFKEHGNALNDYARRDVKVLVVGNPANTNCLIASASAPSLPKQNFTCLTRLDHNRALAQISQKLRIPVQDVKNVVIWGNHSSTQYPDLSYSTIQNIGNPPISTNARAIINDENWISKDFISSVQLRGAKIIETRKLGSAASAAHAVCGHIKDWLLGTKNGEIVSMGVISDGSYGVAKDIIYSFPVVCSEGKWTIVQGLALSEFSKKQMQITADELLEEKKDAFSFLNEKTA